ncbi:MAG: HPF/RaiA family ribosome-associated protein [bacterium]
MRLQLIFEKVSLTGDIKEKIEKKFTSLDKYMRSVSADLRQGFVKLSKGDRWGYKVKIAVKTPKKEVVVEETDAKLLTAVDKAEQKISRVVRKTIEKMRTRKR